MAARLAAGNAPGVSCVGCCLELAETIYPRIDVITEKLLAFNDLCDEGKCVAEKFKELGGLLHERFELEDCLIEVLHNAHKEEAAVQA